MSQSQRRTRGMHQSQKPGDEAKGDAEGREREQCAKRGATQVTMGQDDASWQGACREASDERTGCDSRKDWGGRALTGVVHMIRPIVSLR